MSRSRRTSASENGSTLVELLVTIALMTIVGGVLLGALGSVQRSEAFVSGRAKSLDELRLTMARITKDARQASSVLGSTPDRLEMETYVLGVETTVAYQASGTTLTRQEGSGEPVLIQEHLSSNDLFAFQPSAEHPGVVTITLIVHPPDRPDTDVTVRSEVRMRNRGSA